VASQGTIDLETAEQQAAKNIPPSCQLKQEESGSYGVTLSWNSYNATTVLLNGESVENNGTQTIFPTVSASYTLQAVNAFSNERADTNLEINPKFTIEGNWKLSFLNNHYNFLKIDGISGTARTWVYGLDIYGSLTTTNIVDQIMDVTGTKDGIIVRGSNPTLATTSVKDPTYKPDTFCFQKRPDGSISISVRDTNRDWVPVTIDPCSPKCE
jgi:hypothetical protein